MKKIFLFTAATIGLLACSNEMALNGDDTFSGTTQMQKAPIQDGMIPVAKLTKNGEIELLFLQKDVQELMRKSFDKINPDLTLVYVDVEDNNIKDSEAGLLFQILNEKQGVRVTAISMALTLENGVYYLLKAEDVMKSGSNAFISCSSNCTQGGCSPTEISTGVWACSAPNCTNTNATYYYCIPTPMGGKELYKYEKPIDAWIPPVSDTARHKTPKHILEPYFAVANHIMLWIRMNSESETNSFGE